MWYDRTLEAQALREKGVPQDEKAQGYLVDAVLLPSVSIS